MLEGAELGAGVLEAGVLEAEVLEAEVLEAEARVETEALWEEIRTSAAYRPLVTTPKDLMYPCPRSLPGRIPPT